MNTEQSPPPYGSPAVGSPPVRRDVEAVEKVLKA